MQEFLPWLKKKTQFIMLLAEVQSIFISIWPRTILGFRKKKNLMPVDCLVNCQLTKPQISDYEMGSEFDGENSPVKGKSFDNLLDSYYLCWIWCFMLHILLQFLYFHSAFHFEILK